MCLTPTSGAIRPAAPRSTWTASPGRRCCGSCSATPTRQRPRRGPASAYSPCWSATGKSSTCSQMTGSSWRSATPPRRSPGGPMPDKGHIELERQIDSISVGVRHRKDPGDLNALMKSIEEVGLLQPITVTPDGVLVCGWRRLEAMRRLGKRTLSVWVRSGISDQLSHVLAQQDENEQRKPLSPVETARLYAEIKMLEQEDAQRRMAATQFGGAGRDGEASGSGESPEPCGDSRSRAAQKLTGRDGWQRLEQTNWIESVAKDETLGESVREFAANMLSEIDGGAPVSPAYKRVKAAVELASS